jgi:hypothetical protein
MALVGVLGLVGAVLVVRGSVLALGLLAFAELWILWLGLNGGLPGGTRALLVAPSLMVIVMCVGAGRWVRMHSE